MAAATVSEKGWVVIPKEIRKRYGLKKGSKIHFIDLGGHVYLIPVLNDPIGDALGMFKGDDSHAIIQDLLDERRKQREQEEQSLKRWGPPHSKPD